MTKFYVTYGGNTDRRNNYSVVEAAHYSEAREIIFDACQEFWGFVYEEQDWWLKGKGCNQAEYYGLTEVPLGPHRRAES